MTDTTDALKRISYTYMGRTGEQLYCYADAPSGTTRYVFVYKAIIGAAKALKYAHQMLAEANIRPAAELVFEDDFPGARRARVRQHANTVSAAIVSVVGDHVIEADTFPDADQARDWLNEKAKEYSRG